VCARTPTSRKRERRNIHKAGQVANVFDCGREFLVEFLARGGDVIVDGIHSLRKRALEFCQVALGLALAAASQFVCLLPKII
jgi:hypothetical protein